MKNKPRLLDLFCGAGGAGMGYHRAGFEVVVVDIKPQPHYPFEFHQADALTYPLDGFDAYHASPPCQIHSVLTELQRAKGQYKGDYTNLIPPVKTKLMDTSKPFVIENVDSKIVKRFMENPIRLCGSMFSLGVIRHRLFECHPFIFPPGHYPERHREVAARPDYCCVVGMGGVWRGKNGSRRTEDWMTAMGIDWASRYELTQAIPPAYTEFIGKYLMQHVMELKGSLPII
jgi:DNA (cytosine-5)-methyltransferase 1